VLEDILDQRRRYMRKEWSQRKRPLVAEPKPRTFECNITSSFLIIAFFGTYTENKSRDAISELMKISAETARKYQEDGTIAIVETKDLEIVIGFKYLKAN